MITLLFPWAALLLPLPVLARWLLPPRPASAAGALRVPFFDRLGAGGPALTAGRGSRSLMAAAALAWLLLIGAAMRPAWVGPPQPLPAEGRDIMLAVDLSGSMGREDFLTDGRPADRLDVVRAAADAFIARRRGDRIGLVLFSDRAYLQAPLTYDHGVVARLLDQAQVGLTGTETAIGDAIAIAAKRLKDRPEGDRVLILMTDGASNAGVTTPERAAELAKSLGIRIYTIGVGATRMRVQGLFGTQVVNPSADLDETTLTRIADETGGKFFRATDAEGLAQIYREIDRIEPVAADPLQMRPQVSLVHLPLAGALVIAFAIAAARLWPRRGA